MCALARALNTAKKKGVLDGDLSQSLTDAVFEVGATGGRPSARGAPHRLDEQGRANLRLFPSLHGGRSAADKAGPEYDADHLAFRPFRAVALAGLSS